MNYKVSIIVPVYNVEKYLRKCLDSIVNQTYKDIEIILIDDGSTDNSGKICDEYALNDNKICVIHSSNNGVSYARNYGINKAKGKYILFIDGDDFIDENYVQELITLTKKEDYDLVICNEYDYFTISNYISPREILLPLTGIFKYDYYRLKNIIEPPYLKLYKMEIINNFDIRFKENISYCEDQIFNMEYFRYVNKYAFVNKPLYYHIHEKNNSLGKIKNKINMEATIKKIKIEIDFLTDMNIDNKDKLLGEHIFNFILNFSDLKDEKSTYKNYKNRTKKIKRMFLDSITYKNLSFKQKIQFFCIKYNLIFILYCWSKIRLFKTNKYLKE